MPERFNCGDFESWAVLYAAGELGETERAAVEAHARECATCAAVLRREVKMCDAVAERGVAAEEIDRSGLLLSRCRSELAEALDDAEKRTARPGWRGMLSAQRWCAGFGRALAFHPGWSAAALLILGAFGGLGARAWYRETSLPLPGKPLMTVSAAPRISDQDLETMGVQGIRLEPENDGIAPNVEVQMFSNRPILVQGSADDAEIRHVLTYVIAHPQRFDPAMRLDSIDVLRTRADDPQVRGVLCQAARSDHNPAVRLKALEALDGSGNDPDVLQTMLGALAADDNSGVRVEAVNALLAALGASDAAAAPLDAGALGVLRDRMQNDPNHYIRLRSATVLERLASQEIGATGTPTPSRPQP